MCASFGQGERDGLQQGRVINRFVQPRHRAGLQGLGAETYASGEEFIEAMPGHAPDCLLLDLQLPGLNGLAVQTWLQQSGLKLPVIFITASEGLEARTQALESGAVAWLCKPVDDAALLQTITFALAK